LDTDSVSQVLVFLGTVAGGAEAGGVADITAAMDRTKGIMAVVTMAVVTMAVVTMAAGTATAAMTDLMNQRPQPSLTRIALTPALSRRERESGGCRGLRVASRGWECNR
jgi:hypothetical protein